MLRLWRDARHGEILNTFAEVLEVGTFPDLSPAPYRSTSRSAYHSLPSIIELSNRSQVADAYTDFTAVAQSQTLVAEW